MQGFPARGRGIRERVMKAAEKLRVLNGLRDVARGAEAPGLWAPGAAWHGSHPWNEGARTEATADLRRALPDMERRDLIFLGGIGRADPRMDPDGAGRPLIAAMGHYQGTFRHDLCGIPATQGVVHLRFAEVHRVEDGRIAESWCLWDLLDLMRQAGVWPCAPSLGAEGMWPGPATGDGLRTFDTEDGDRAFGIVMAMHAALGRFDGKSVFSVPQEPYWHPDFLWYGPAGVGTTRGLDGFRHHHQIPFLNGFRDRRGAGHYVRLADGPYVVTGGWPSVVGTHTGEWLGLPPTGRRIEMRVMDFYRVEGELIRENWVPIDVLDIMRQMGFDALARLRHLRGAPEGEVRPEGAAP
jgi:predicted ester cyclase